MEQVKFNVDDDWLIIAVVILSTLLSFEKRVCKRSIIASYLGLLLCCIDKIPLTK